MVGSALSPAAVYITMRALRCSPRPSLSNSGLTMEGWFSGRTAMESPVLYEMFELDRSKVASMTVRSGVLGDVSNVACDKVA